jgi:hypothetical protein
MNIPNFENVTFTERNGTLTDPWQLILQNLFSELQGGVGNEGFEISIVTSDPNSITPPASGGQLLVIQDSFGNQNGVTAGTIVFDPYAVNGAILPARNGQLKVLLNDGTFHGITNT